MVHTFELALPSVEQQISADFYPENPVAGKRLSGNLSTVWRFCWGIGALLAGLLVDRIGPARMLIIYLLGCGFMCMLTGVSYQLLTLSTAMIMMGAFASIYHPAGLDYISAITDDSNRTRALGIHGIFGSVGIASAPFIAWIVFSFGFSWRQFYLLLALPAFVVAMAMVESSRRIAQRAKREHLPPENIPPLKEHHSNWLAFWVLTVIAVLQGFVYSAQMTFLPRYLSGSDAISLESIQAGLQHGKILAAGALLLGCIGQYLSARLAKPHRLEQQLTLITFCNVPCLIWMALANPQSRWLAAGLFCIVHFMHQPIYNSLIPRYAPLRRRSFCFGISFALGLGLGSSGATFAGSFLDERLIYLTLAGVAGLAGLIGIVLSRLGPRNRTRVEQVV
jgi:MFS family permease